MAFSGWMAKVAFNKLCFTQTRTAERQETLWKMMTSVSPGGRKKGRRTGRLKKRQLEKFYEIGRSPMKIAFPGLNERITHMPAEPIQIAKEEGESLPDLNAEYREKLKLDAGRDKRRMKEKMHPLERGFAGHGLLGQKLGPPPPYEDVNFEGFETYCLDINRTCKMDKLVGRIYTTHALVITGNGKGLAGYGIGRAPIFKTNIAVAKAMKDASKRLFSVDLLENRTIYQDFFAECRNTRIFAQRCSEGHGVVCHARLQKLCELIGIKDIYVKVEGTTSNYDSLIFAFVTGIVNQETFEQLAERKRMHVVELTAGRQYFPAIVASPQKVPVKEGTRIAEKDRFKLDDFYGEGRLPLKKAPAPHIYTNTSRHEFAQWRKFPFRNMEKTMIRLLADEVVPRWTRKERHDLAKMEHEMVVSGQKPMPLGIGLTHVIPRAEGK